MNAHEKLEQLTDEITQLRRRREELAAKLREDAIKQMATEGSFELDFGLAFELASLDIQIENKMHARVLFKELHFAELWS